MPSLLLNSSMFTHIKKFYANLYKLFFSKSFGCKFRYIKFLTMLYPNESTRPLRAIIYIKDIARDINCWT